MTTLKRRIQFRRGKSAALKSANETLESGELVLETDTGKYKLGDGVTSWNDLEYSGLKIPTGTNDVYVLQKGEYVPAIMVEAPSEWAPEIAEIGAIVLTVDEDMTAYHLTGSNVEVNA